MKKLPRSFVTGLVVVAALAHDVGVEAATKYGGGAACRPYVYADASDVLVDMDGVSPPGKGATEIGQERLMRTTTIVLAGAGCGLVAGAALLSALPADAQGIVRRVGGSQCVPVYYGSDEYENSDEGFYYDDEASGTGYAHCPSAEHTSSSVEAIDADLKYQDNSTTKCMSCRWYLTTHLGSTYYSSYRYSDGSTGSSCVSSFTGRGTMTWSSFTWGSISNVSALNAYCVLPRAGGTQVIRSYRITTSVPFP